MKVYNQSERMLYMGDKKDFVPNNNNRIEKIMDKFLTIKEIPDRNKKKQHFEKMLEVFRSTKDEEDTHIGELSDEEIDFVSAAGIGRPDYVVCPYCHKKIRADLLEKHKIMAHKKGI